MKSREGVGAELGEPVGVVSCRCRMLSNLSRSNVSSVKRAAPPGLIPVRPGVRVAKWLHGPQGSIMASGEREGAQIGVEREKNDQHHENAIRLAP